MCSHSPATGIVTTDPAGQLSADDERIHAWCRVCWRKTCHEEAVHTIRNTTGRQAYYERFRR